MRLIWLFYTFGDYLFFGAFRCFCYFCAPAARRTECDIKSCGSLAECWNQTKPQACCLCLAKCWFKLLFPAPPPPWSWSKVALFNLLIYGSHKNWRQTAGDKSVQNASTLELKPYSMGRYQWRWDFIHLIQFNNFIIKQCATCWLYSHALIGVPNIDLSGQKGAISVDDIRNVGNGKSQFAITTA